MIRTRDRRIRNPLLYPAELRGRPIFKPFLQTVRLPVYERHPTLGNRPVHPTRRTERTLHHGDTPSGRQVLSVVTPTQVLVPETSRKWVGWSLRRCRLRTVRCGLQERCPSDDHFIELGHFASWPKWQPWGKGLWFMPFPPISQADLRRQPCPPIPRLAPDLNSPCLVGRGRYSPAALGTVCPDSAGTVCLRKRSCSPDF